MKRLGWWALVGALVGIACSSSGSSGMGAPCTGSSSCSSGLLCLTAFSQADGGCASLGLQCLQSCYSDADCGILGNYSCFASCGGAGAAYCRAD